jgi:uncharacterized membrane protein
VLVLTMILAVLTFVLLSGAYGVYFTYSNSVVPALDQLDAEQAVAAMRRANVVIVNPIFLLSFLGPVVTGAVTGFLLLGLDEGTSALLFFSATVVYLFGSIILTGAVNIPLNNALENSTSTDWTQRWADFSPRWRKYNLVRALLTMVALALVGIGLYTW